MKTFLIATVAAVTALSPALIPAAMAYPGERSDRDDRGDGRFERRGDRDGREVRRDNRRHNGFWYNGRFFAASKRAAASLRGAGLRAYGV